MALLSRPRNGLIAAAVVTTVGLLSVVAAVVGLRGGDPQRTVADPGSSVPVETTSATDPPSATADPTPTASPSASPTPKRTPTKKKAPPPKPKPVTVAKPPPPPPPGPPPGPGAPPPGASCPKLTGPPAARSAVASTMSSASAHAFRPTLSLSDTPPPITVRVALIQGVGWEESGWQSTMQACDGGLGTMQVMPDTATWMNEKYGTSYDRASLTGNVFLGTGLLAWLTRYFGDRYFNGNYGLGGDPVKIVLLDMVISAYQAGFGSVDNAMAAGQDLPNRWYVDTVEGFMAHAPWNAPAASPS